MATIKVMSSARLQPARSFPRSPNSFAEILGGGQRQAREKTYESFVTELFTRLVLGFGKAIAEDDDCPLELVQPLVTR